MYGLFMSTPLLRDILISPHHYCYDIIELFKDLLLLILQL
ncbi:hypothetical protein DAD63_01645 [Streptococcus agalactiae]|uniref:Uncharacterized protein n=1 Tax=Streptococcus agalactiae TaxID=1311 RepID=A0A0G2Z7V8_STRAG|nr:hypothetical protein A964_1718 [Streptococcus agalactiae GD201008-001]AKI96156.1 Hypothetical protein RDF_1741 [Streptococcus agalactiae]AYY65049.1 hypothetical protein EGX70_09695 [Streptococcus sp. FDAARGOS_522]CCW38636.1 hypothetical protein BSA_18690 [Streptococcus agalactiae 09mas018883]AQY24992.1 hypothetical protein B1H24_09585 [Streptococcus agalactiae]